MNHRIDRLVAGGLALAGLAASASAAAADNVDAIALYSQGAAVVQDSQTKTLKAGHQQIGWPVAGNVQADTFWLAGNGVTLDGFSQAATISGVGQDPLAARIDAPVTLTPPGPDAKPVQGLLVALNDGVAFVRVGGDIRRITPASPTTISWAGTIATSDAAAAAPLTLDVAADQAGPHAMTATYQTDAPSWQASYTGRFDASTQRLALHGMAIIDNTGRSALDADKAWLVAGDIARATPGPTPMPAPMMMAKRVAASAAGAPEATGDVYRYPLPGGLHVAAGQTRAIALMPAVSLSAKRGYRFDNAALSDTGESRRHVAVSLRLTNSTDKPLPAGTVRVYDASHAAQLMGSDTIDDTPKSAPVVLHLGDAFDLTATHAVSRKAVENQALKTQTTVTIKLFNAGKTAHDITIAERLPDHATLADDVPKPSGGTADRPEWQVTVPAGGQKTFSYRFIQAEAG